MTTSRRSFLRTAVASAGVAALSGCELPRPARVRRRNAVLFIGDEGWLISDYNKHEIGPVARAESWQRPGKLIVPSPGHHKEWIDCCKTRTQPTCSFAYGAPLTETVLLANAAARARPGVELQWNAKRMRFDDEAANAMLDEPARDGFTA